MIKPEIPFGFQDILPVEAGQRRRLENKFRQIFTKFGFGEVITPSIEYYDVLTTESGDDLADKMIKLVANGQLLALRPELTTPIARLAAQRLADQPTPIRLFYLANVFRDEPPEQGQKREFLQAGAELIGENSTLAEAEMILLLTELLNVSALKNWSLGFNEPNFLQLNLAAVNLAGEQKRKILEALVKKSIVHYEQQIDQLALPVSTKRKLKQIPRLKGKPDEVLKVASQLSISREAEKPLEKIAMLSEHLKNFNLKNIEVDFSLVKNLAYYTGIIFEIYAAGAGLPIGGGGRYDHLLTAFKTSKPAIGFALNFDRLELALTNQAALQSKKRTQYFVFSQTPNINLLKVGLDLQRKNLSYHLCYQPLNLREARQAAQVKECQYLLEVKASGKTKEIKIEQS